MTARNIGVACVLLLLMAVPASEVGAQNTPDEIERVIGAFLVPFSNGDVPAFIDYFAEDATVFMPSSAAGASPGRVQGKAAIAQEFDALYARLKAAASGRGPGTRPAIQPRDLVVQRLHDVAIATFHLGTETSRGRRTFVLRRTDAGWKIAHLHASIFRVE